MSDAIVYDGARCWCSVTRLLLSRASWAAVQVDEQARLVAAVLGSVPDTMPQTAQSGEYLGNFMATKQLVAAAELVGDCLGVVNAANNQTEKAISRKRMHAATVRYARALDSREHVTQQRWVKAHQFQSLEKLTKDERQRQLAQMSPQQRRDVMGNHFADRLAVRARERGA